jgi:hypothetical protein
MKDAKICAVPTAKDQPFLTPHSHLKLNAETHLVPITTSISIAPDAAKQPLILRPIKISIGTTLAAIA